MIICPYLSILLVVVVRVPELSAQCILAIHGVIFEQPTWTILQS